MHPRPARLLRLAATALAVLFLYWATPARATPSASVHLPTAELASADTVGVPPASPRAVAYERGNTALWALNSAIGLLLPWLIFASGLSARLRTAARRVGRGWLGTLLVYFVCFGVLYGVLTLPLAYWEGFVREHAYGLSTQTPAKWAHDTLVGGAIGLALGAGTIWVPYLLFRRSPRRWWLWTAAAALPVILLLQLVAPVWIEPRFNRFGPMHDRALEARVRALAARAGLTRVAVYEVDKSADTRALNAYVSGLGGTQRVVLWDTLLERLDEREVLAVTAHELGHYVMGHAWLGALLGAATLLAGLYGVHRTADAALARWGPRAGVRELADPAALPLLLALGGAALLVLEPLGLAVSRRLEHAADRYALELTHDNAALGRTFVALQADNLGDPWPPAWVVLLRYSHPPLGARIAFANHYRPWDRAGREDASDGK